MQTPPIVIFCNLIFCPTKNFNQFSSENSEFFFHAKNNQWQKMAKKKIYIYIYFFTDLYPATPEGPAEPPGGG